MCVAFSMAGFGIALQNAQANGFVGNLKDSQTKFGFLHGSYGILSPATYIAYRVNSRFFRVGSFRRSFGCHKLRDQGTMVLPLFDIGIHWNIDYRTVNVCLPFQEARR